MPFISYAQNFEDVMLWRALGNVANGFYVDVGAWSPDIDSVTKAFSERGWHGINVEPNPVYFAKLRTARPRDVNLRLAIGEASGAVSMTFFEESGLSTADASFAKGHIAAGFASSVETVEMKTLSDVWREYIPPSQPVHFLKVDVEGLERAALSGNDWTNNRPWVVVVEATLPLTQTESHAEWEHLLLEARYGFVYADGLNRYYVAREHPELHDAFKYPPNVFDGFIFVEVAEARKKVVELESMILEGHRALSELQQRYTFSEKSLAESRRRIEVSELGLIASRHREQQARERAMAEEKALRLAVETRDQLLTDAQGRAEVALDRYNALVHSSSWRATAPLRRIYSLMPKSLLHQARRAAKGIWWAATPWRMPARLRFLRERAAAKASASVKTSMLPLADFFSEASLSAAAGGSCEEFLWGTLPRDSIVDRWSAARWCVGLLRGSPELRARFPRAISAGETGAFAQWLLHEGGDALDLSNASRGHLMNLLRESISGGARNFFLLRADVREGLPHGLTPAGRIALFRWFVQHGRAEGGLRPEEILWLFLEAAEDPSLEVARAYRFTPAWQRQFQDGLTVFGSGAFAEWFAATYAMDRQWVDRSVWPTLSSPASQLRQAYFAQEEWRAWHPDAFESTDRAVALVKWLQSELAGLSPEARQWCLGLDVQQVARELTVDGVNVIGHFCFPSGVRASVEALVEGMHRSCIATSLRDLRTDLKDEPFHWRFDGLEEFDTTLIHTQPTPFFDRAYALSDLAERQPRPYRIAYWYWEFDSIPDAWTAQASKVDEVWAATEFVAKGIRARLDVPVKTLFPGVQLGAYTRRERRHFGLEEGKFIFLFNFHMNSVMERKNPLGLIKAFKAAFGTDDQVALVLKTMFGHHHPAQIRQLHDAIGESNIKLIDETYNSDEVLSLMDACDAYVSLHRSEGLGLTMAEAMLMGKPVIATNYSGNTDFMDDTNSLLVPYELVKLEHDLPPYEAGLCWAEPSQAHAAALMRRLVDEPDWAREVALRGQRSAQAKLSVEAAGRRIAHRLGEIKAARRCAARG